jgi:type II secretory pathway pseudopilin PulG
MMPVTSYRRIPQTGFTLVELIIAVATSSLLLAGMMSAIFFATRSADTNTATVFAIAGSLAMDDITAELRDAVYFKQRTANSVMFTVPDRDGDGDVETIRYSWSGTAGAPLSREYNGGTAVPVLDSVYAFSLTYTVQTNASVNKLLFVVPDENNLASVDVNSKTAFQGWGYQVTAITASRPQAELQAAAALNDVIYISETFMSGDLNSKLKTTAVGVVSEEGFLNNDFGLASADGPAFSGSQIVITDNSHYITSAFGIGTLQLITSGTQSLRSIAGTAASDLQLLAVKTGSGTQPATIGVIGTGGSLYGGGTAAAPRVILPWGENDFDYNKLTSNGLSLAQRSIDWAARKVVVTSVGITLQIGADSGSAVQTRTEIRSKPRA